MSKTTNTLNNNYDIQESWIRRQVDNFKDDSFVDLALAKNEIEEAGITAFATPTDVDAFRNNHLSELGMKRLSSALRTYKKRSARRLTTRRLDINISLAAYLALEALVREQGLTKIQLIERLVLEEKEKSDDSCDSVTSCIR